MCPRLSAAIFSTMKNLDNLAAVWRKESENRTMKRAQWPGTQLIFYSSFFLSSFLLNGIARKTMYSTLSFAEAKYLAKAWDLVSSSIAKRAERPFNKKKDGRSTPSFSVSYSPLPNSSGPPALPRMFSTQDRTLSNQHVAFVSSLAVEQSVIELRSSRLAVLFLLLL